MYVTEAYRILVSLKLHGPAGLTPAQIAEARAVVTAHASDDPLYRKVLRDLTEAAR